MDASSLTGFELNNAVLSAIDTAYIGSGVSLNEPVNSRDDWRLCEDILSAFGYTLEQVEDSKEWRSRVPKLDLVVTGETPRMAILRCFVAHQQMDRH